MAEAVRAAAEIAGGWAPILKGIELRSGVKGVFKISVDGEIVYDKATAGHFPTARETAHAIEARLGKKLSWT